MHMGLEIEDEVHDNLYYGPNALSRNAWESRYVVFDRRFRTFITTIGNAEEKGIGIILESDGDVSNL